MTGKCSSSGRSPDASLLVADNKDSAVDQTKLATDLSVAPETTTSRMLPCVRVVVRTVPPVRPMNLSRTYALFCRIMKEDSGQDLIEYSLLAAFISVSSMLVMTNLGTAINSLYTSLNTDTQALQAAL